MTMIMTMGFIVLIIPIEVKAMHPPPPSPSLSPNSLSSSHFLQPQFDGASAYNYKRLAKFTFCIWMTCRVIKCQVCSVRCEEGELVCLVTQLGIHEMGFTYRYFFLFYFIFTSST